jgi:23S rRNA pseudouridine1911/1915/1917 synthase
LEETIKSFYMESFEIIYQDEFLAVISKPPGIAVQSNNQEKLDLESILKEYFQRFIFLVNRIDQPVSGLLMIAFTPEIETILRKQIETNVIQKKYWAVTEKPLKDKKGILNHFHIKVNQKAICTDFEQPNSKICTLKFEEIKKSDKYFLYEIILLTGRFHQIRAQLQAAGTSIKGDLKYGAKRSNSFPGIHLHATELSFVHPKTEEKIHVANYPKHDTLWHFFNSAL